MQKDEHAMDPIYAGAAGFIAFLGVAALGSLVDFMVILVGTSPTMADFPLSPITILAIIVTAFASAMFYGRWKNVPTATRKGAFVGSLFGTGFTVFLALWISTF